MPVDPLMEFARPAAAPSPVGDGEVVKDEQVARAKANFSLDGGDIQSKMFEEDQLCGERVELHPTEEARSGLDTGEPGRAGGRLDNARQAAFGIAVRVIPRPCDSPYAFRLPRSVARSRQRRWPRRARSGTSRVTAVTPTAERGTVSAVYRATS